MDGRGLLAGGLLLLGGCGERSDEVTRLDGGVSEPGRVLFMKDSRIGIEGGQGVFTDTRDGRTTSVRFDLPMDVVDPDPIHLSIPLGETEAGIVVMIDDYGTRQRSDRPDCAGRSESVVRVFSLPLARELAAIPAESCLKKIKGGEPLATWLDADRFRIETSPKRVFALTGADGIDELKGS